ncbi:MAG: efflux RND transporter periplasmic adaptor subunit [Acidobacteria bacterium]|nr:efflux RND transporter periplasmic adaptor subunit [Acidobacteriota bacterium]
MPLRLTVIALTLAAGLACGKKESLSEAPALPQVKVRLAPTSGEDGALWVAASLQSTRSATISTRMAAQVRRVLAQEGQRVQAGALLLSLSDDDLQGQLKAAETGLAAAEAYLRRVQNLQALKASTPAELEQATAQAEQARGGVVALKAQIAYTQIRAPFSGTVQARRVNEGDFVGPGMPLLEFVSEGALELVASVSEEEAKALKVGQKVRFEVEGRSGEGQVTALSPGGDAVSHRGTLRARVLSPSGLRVGSFGRIQVPGLKLQGLSIPRSALVQRGELSGVFVAREGKAELRWLSLGEAAGDRLPVKAGLKAGEAVIDAPGDLKDGQPVEVRP